MKLLRKVKLNYLLTGLLVALCFYTVTWKTVAASAPTPDFYTTLTDQRDTVPVKPRPLNSSDTIPVRSSVPDSILRRGDSVIVTPVTDTFSLKLSKDTLDAPVEYSAEDSAVVLVQEKKIILYGKTETRYQQVVLNAPRVEIDNRTSLLTAVNSKDTLGRIVDMVRFKDGDQQFDADTIVYNFKTQRGLTKNTFTQQGEMFVQGEEIKKVDAVTVFVRSGRFTTCNLDHPHFAFRTNKMKVISNKVAVSGPTHPEFEDVPVPIYLPFGFYPLNRGRHSGFMAPQFTVNEEFGLGLEGLGYYKVLNDYVDLTFQANIYSYGGWTANISPKYRKRYRYSGSLNFSVQNTKAFFKGDPDFLKNRSYFLSWGHSVDSRARPGTAFSANVSAGSTKYNELVPNNPNLNFRNQLSSSINYSKSWEGKPYNLSLSANHSQNNRERLINVSLPDVGFNINTIYPFQAKELIGTPKWYEKLGVSYSGAFRNQLAFYDTAFQFKRLIDTLQWGAQHSVPITLSLPPMGPLVVSPSLSFDEIWSAQRFRRVWNPTLKKVDTLVTKGIFTDRRVQMGIGLGTSIFGTKEFKNSRIMAIRHTIRPQISASYKPDLSKRHYYDVQIDTNGNSYRFSELEGSLYNFFPEGVFGGLGIQIDNNLEMKWRSKKDTGEAAIKKIRLIDGYGIQTGYNFIADSFQLSPVTLYLRSTLFEKINISASMIFDPYQYDRRGFPVNRFAWQGDRFSMGRFRTGNIAISTQFRSKPKDPKVEEQRKQQSEDLMTSDPALAGDQQRMMEYMQRNPNEFVDFNIPWSVNLSYSLFFNEQLKKDYSGFEKEFSSNLNFSGSFNLTEKWNFSTNGYFNFDTRQLQMFQMSISRDMHCWQMAIGVTPIGPTRFFNIMISPKASVLQDIKINRTRSFKDF